MAHFLRGITLLIMLAGPGLAQSAYDAGYHDGYNDRWPSSVPNFSTDYGRGFNTGQDDSYEDEERHQRVMDWLDPGPRE